MTSPREALIALLTNADLSRDEWTQSTYEAQADAILAAGWRYDGSCRDCQANLDTNGGQHEFWCGPFGSDVVIDA